MRNIIFIAAPAAGKGTLSDMLQDKYGYEHISTGDLLRNEKNKATPLGQEIARLMDSGSLVPDEIVLKLLDDYIKEMNTTKSFILDGVPRNESQIKPVLDIMGDKDYVVIFLDIDYEKAMNRTLGRISCPKCKKVYNKFSQEFKPKVEGICDNCGEELVSRSDDNPDTYRVRYDTYMNETKAIIDYFNSINKLESIKVSDDINDDLNRIERIIN